MLKIIALIGLAASLSAGTITSSASCEVRVNTFDDPWTITSGPLSCVGDATSDYGSHAHAAVNMSYNDFGVAVSLTATGEPFAYSFASGSISETALILSDGPVRPGFALLDFSGDAGCVECWVSASASFFGDVNWLGHYGDCSSVIKAACNGPVMVPVTLGVAVPLTVSATSSGDGSLGSYAFANAAVSFQFFEADGVTPVGFVDPPAGDAGASAPEPISAALVGIGLILVALKKKNGSRSLRRDPR